eukprot:721170_1
MLLQTCWMVQVKISIAITTTLYCFDKRNENITTFRYYLEINKTNGLEMDGKLSDDERQMIAENKGKTEGLAIRICGSFECNYKDIEFSKNSDVTDHGLVLYVIHHTSDMTLRKIEMEYQKPSMSTKFSEYFKFH